MASELVVGGGLTLAGVAMGAALAYAADRRLWRRSQALTARLLLAECYPHLWDTPYADWTIHMERLRVHLDAAGAPAKLLTELVQAIENCRDSVARDLNTGDFDPDTGPSLSLPLLDRYDAAARAITAAIW